MTLKELLISSRIPRREAEILLSFLLNKTREFFIIHPDFEIEKIVYKKFRELESKHLAGWSIATLIGSKEFYGLNFQVDKNVLVPRPETELMVEEILNLVIPSQSTINIIDVGTGSGAIIITLALELRKSNLTSFKNTGFKAIDISVSALKIAKLNSQIYKLNKNIKFFSGNLLRPLINKNDYEDLFKKDVIIAANLPYLSPLQVKTSPSIQKEPKLALMAGSDGLKCYRELFEQLKSIYSGVAHKNIHIFCEIDPSQKNTFKLLLKKNFPEASLMIKKDLAGRPRLAQIYLKSTIKK